MGLIAKLKLLLKIQKPAGQIIGQMKELNDGKRGWKTLGFWVTLVGTLSSTTLALTGIIPAPVQLIVTTALQAIYNIMRGAQGADSLLIKGTLTTTEFGLSVLTEIQKGLVAVEAGGIRPEWMTAATGIVGASLAFGQNLACRAPAKEEPLTPADKAVIKAA